MSWAIKVSGGEREKKDPHKYNMSKHPICPGDKQEALSNVKIFLSGLDCNSWLAKDFRLHDHPDNNGGEMWFHMLKHVRVSER